MANLKLILKRFFKNTNLTKAISTLIGAIILNFLIGAVYSLSTLAVYEISYIKGKGGSIDINHLSFYYPLEVVFQCIAAFSSGFIYKKIGLFGVNSLGVIIIGFGYTLMYFSESLIQDLVSMMLGGIGTGLILYPATTNCYEWFNKHNGLVVGIIESTISLGSFFFSFLGEKIINKNGEESNDITNLYDLEIGEKFKEFLIILIICLFFAYIISFFLMYEKKKIEQESYYTFQKEKENKENKNKVNENNNNNNNIISNNKEKKDIKDLINDDKEKNDEKGINDSDIENQDKLGELIDNNLDEKINPKEINENEKNNSINNINPNINNDGSTQIKSLSLTNEQKHNEKHIEINIKNQDINKDDKSKKSKKGKKQKEIKDQIKIAIKSRRLILFVIIVILQIPIGSMSFTLYREIGEYKKIDIKYLQLIGSFTFIFECLSSFAFGILCDYITIKNLLFFINGVGTIFGFLYCLTFNNSLIFFLVQILLSFSSGGYYPLKDFFLLKVFPKEIYIELNSYVSLLVALSINISTSLSYCLISLINDNDLSFWILFISFGALSLIGFILNCFTNEKKINLKERMNKKT